MNIVCVGGGPAGLFLSLLLKKADPRHHVTVIERCLPQETYGFGLVLSETTLARLRQEDSEIHNAILRSSCPFDRLEMAWKNQVIPTSGPGFFGLSRRLLLQELRTRAETLGVFFPPSREIQSVDVDSFLDADLVVGSDGLSSVVRARFADAFAPQIDWRPNRFVCLGSTKPLSCLTFLFDENEHGLFRVHAYPHTPPHTWPHSPIEPSSTWVVECSSDTFLRSGLDPADEEATLAYCEKLLGHRLGDFRLRKNRSIWRKFPTVTCKTLHHRNVVLLGDAAHTLHFSIGSGTKAALDDAASLAHALFKHAGNVAQALSVYEADRRPAIDALSQAAHHSQRFFEHTDFYRSCEPWQFATHFLTRTFRQTLDTLRKHDPDFAAVIENSAARDAETRTGLTLPRPAPPPVRTPFRARGLVLQNRVVFPPTFQYRAEDGMPNDWHLVQLGSRAVAGAGLVFTEMAAVCREGRVTPGCAGLYKPEHVPAWRRIVDFVHKHTDSKIGVSLGHAGRKAAICLPKVKAGQPLPEHESWPLIAASAVPWNEHSQIPREMTGKDLESVLADFVSATELAEQVGFDWLELHMAHGYLLAGFISPLTNLRTDEWGGHLASRIAFPMQVFQTVRTAWPDEKPISVCLSVHDFAPGGLLPDEAVSLARLFKAAGADLIHVSSGGTVPEGLSPGGGLHQIAFAEEIRFRADIATLVRGNVGTDDEANTLVAAGRADLVSVKSSSERSTER
ncbi:MAG TPA: FAD-dependent monooxygenase [Pseudomonadota bacterium]|nr:FAD-dependent monooxygenase [Pseudomonadota bacterium]